MQNGQSPNPALIRKISPISSQGSFHQQSTVDLSGRHALTVTDTALVVAPLSSRVLGIRFFECRRCATVYAGPEVPSSCSECNGREFVDLTDQLQADTYFSRPYDQGEP
jgi:hypothetical protein